MLNEKKRPWLPPFTSDGQETLTSQNLRPHPVSSPPPAALLLLSSSPHHRTPPTALILPLFHRTTPLLRRPPPFLLPLFHPTATPPRPLCVYVCLQQIAGC
ncbi:hypothetical protein HanRHA438_Chr03g0134171 [Helianthus annuus]|uniref:Uncharacterized protein n=1 Tax=Helianthus annuus TaxID=4232 RepID=A0A9K3NX62_HELAN|nr:hypothetical protein HanXRQr2_Chr03g0122221 [Helianthus annuus]KAJ0601872.1 hypothetical protein HanIR_Chr03g0133611 [Helianthus annuus]KAJ0936709.1 hypothetical protein HanRHA438_Chr03g0134171 [Helianthus annuus]